MKYDPKEICSEEELKVTSIENDTIFYDWEVKAVGVNSVEFKDGQRLGVDNATKHVKRGDTLRLYGRGFGYTVRGVAVVGDQCRISILRYRTPLEWATKQCNDCKESDRKREEQTEKNRKDVDVNLPPKFECIDLNGWKKYVENNLDPYGYACVQYVEKWGELMEKQISEGATLKDIAKSSSHEANNEGITSFMYGAAVGVLSQLWVHGEELRQWHNLDTQVKDEGETANNNGGVLNPAILNIGTKTD